MPGRAVKDTNGYVFSESHVRLRVWKDGRLWCPNCRALHEKPAETTDGT
jgi:hypothetical protein